MILSNFQCVEPLFHATQEAALAWLVKAHVRAQNLIDSQTSAAQSPRDPGDRFQTRMASLFRRYGCSPERIKTRGHDSPDFSHTDWDRMELFGLNSRPEGPTMSERSDAFRKATDRVCGLLYGGSETPPAHLIHVTCTGYISPSCAQELVVRKGWHEKTVVTHAYHMGCSAALPAVRMADGFLAGSMGNGPQPTNRVDILHTEICSIHMQASNHSPEQLVVQSLFADGYIKYSATTSCEPGTPLRGLRLTACREVQVPDTRSAITWECGEWGMRMGLSREVPDTICAVLKPYLVELGRQARIPLEDLLARAIFAIHPGGPKIIDQIQGMLGLSEAQIGYSKAVLRDRGNMSSATLPHIWQAILADAAVPAGTPVVSLAFGPGLCVSGAVFEVVGG